MGLTSWSAPGLVGENLTAVAFVFEHERVRVLTAVSEATSSASSWNTIGFSGETLTEDPSFFDDERARMLTAASETLLSGLSGESLLAVPFFFDDKRASMPTNLIGVAFSVTKRSFQASVADLTDDSFFEGTLAAQQIFNRDKPSDLRNC